MVSQDSNKGRWGLSREAAWLFGSQMIIVVCAAVYSAITARVLGLSSKGILTLAIMVPGLLVFAFSSGLDISCTFFISSGRKSASRVAGTALLYSLVAGSVIFAVASILAPWMRSVIFHREIGVTTVLVAFVAVPVGLAAVVLPGVLLGLQRIRELSLTRLAGSLLAAVLTLVLWAVGGLTVFSAVVVSISATALTGLLAWRTLRTSGVRMNLAYNADLLSEEVRHGLKAHFGNLAQWLNYRLDILLIGLMRGPADAGLYAVAVSMGELVWHIPNALAQLIFPRVAKLNRAQAGELTISVCKWTVVIATLALVGMGVFGPSIIRLVVGEEYVPATTALRLLLPGVLALSISKILTGDLNGRGKPECGAYSSFVALPVTLLGNMALIPRMGIAGAAIASSLSYIAGACVMAVLFFRECREPGHRGRSSNLEPALDVRCSVFEVRTSNIGPQTSISEEAR